MDRTCPVCGLLCAKPAHLTAHLRVHTNERPFACPEAGCNRSYKRAEHLRRHLLWHEGTVYHCSKGDCKAVCSSPEALERHVKNHHSSEPSVSLVVCLNDGCGMKFADTGLLALHACHCEPKVVPRLKHPCPEPHCESSFRMVAELHAHQLEQHEATCGDFGCPMLRCKERFGTAAALRGHLKVDHEKPTCKICSTVFSNRRHLTIHMRQHAPDRPTYSCSYENCGRSFSSASNLKTHVKTVHLCEEQYACSFCPKVFKHKKTRVAHEEREHQADAPDLDEVLENNRKREAQQAAIVDRNRTKRVKAVLQ